jgi:hypothetical protein
MPADRFSIRQDRSATLLSMLGLLAIAASAAGTALAQRYRPPPRPPQLEGNWIKQQSVPNPNFGKPLPGTNPYQREYDMRETVTKQRVDGDAVLRDIGRSLRYDIESWNYRSQQRQPVPPRPPVVPSRPQYQPAQPQYIPSQPQVVERVMSQPATLVTPAAPAKNVIPTAAPRANADFSLTVSRALRENGSTRTDAAQVVLAQDAAARINESVASAVDRSGNEAMQKAWKDSLADGSAKAMADFEQQFKDALAAVDPTAAGHLSLSVRLASLVGNLEDGLLTSEGKRKAIEDLMADVAALPANDPLREGLVAESKRLRQLQQIGELMDLAVLEPQPLVPIWEGFDAVGLPIEAFTGFLGLPVMTSPAESLADTAGKGGVRLVNPESTGTEVRFSIGGQSQKMPPGSEIGLDGPGSVIFDPGNGQYRGINVTSGTWEWRRDDALWNLRMVQPEITIQNPGFDGVFHYTVNGRQASLNKGESATHADPLPLRVAFDRGDGGAPSTKVLAEGVYAVAIDAGSKWLDLFRTDVDTAGEKSATEAVSARPPSARKGGEVKKALADPEQRRRMNDLIEALRSTRE